MCILDADVPNDIRPGFIEMRSHNREKSQPEIGVNKYLPNNSGHPLLEEQQDEGNIIFQDFQQHKEEERVMSQI